MPMPAETMVVGERKFTEATGKRYPDMMLSLRHGAVRDIYHAIPLVKIHSKFQKPFLERITKIVNAEITATAKRTGLPIPDASQGRGLFDDEIEDINMVLTDLEMFSMHDSFGHSGIDGYRRSRQLPCGEETLQGLYDAQREHILKHGMYDHSKSVNNLCFLHRDSPIWQAYYRAWEEGKGSMVIPARKRTRTIRIAGPKPLPRWRRILDAIFN